MLDKLSETFKFFIFLTVYTVAIAYWAGALTSNLNAQIDNLDDQSNINAKTVELLNAHIKECQERTVLHARLEEHVLHLRTDVDFLMNVHRQKEILNGFKKR